MSRRNDLGDLTYGAAWARAVGPHTPRPATTRPGSSPDGGESLDIRGDTAPTAVRRPIPLYVYAVLAAFALIVAACLLWPT